MDRKMKKKTSTTKIINQPNKQNIVQSRGTWSQSEKRGPVTSSWSCDRQLRTQQREISSTLNA